MESRRLKVQVYMTHSCTVVDQQSDTVIFVVGLLDYHDEGDEGGGKLGHSMVWPGGEVILCHRQRFLICLGGLRDNRCVG